MALLQSSRCPMVSRASRRSVVVRATYDSASGEQPAEGEESLRVKERDRASGIPAPVAAVT